MNCCFKLLPGTPQLVWGQIWFLASLCRGQDCRVCSGVCGAVSHGHSDVCSRPRRYRWERRSEMAVSSVGAVDGGLSVA